MGPFVSDHVRHNGASVDVKDEEGGRGTAKTKHDNKGFLDTGVSKKSSHEV